MKERSDIVVSQAAGPGQDFLLKMRDIKLTGQKVVYLDETWLNAGHTVGRCWLDADGNGGINVPSGRGSRLIILHAGTRAGSFPARSCVSRVSRVRQITMTRWMGKHLQHG